VGAACTNAADCVDNARCNPRTSTCEAIVYRAPGEPCDDGVSFCFLGGCPIREPSPVCPTILPRGAHCDPKDDTTTCDAFDQCSGGTCQGESTNVCK
jgi:hypothetical protein